MGSKTPAGPAGTVGQSAWARSLRTFTKPGTDLTYSQWQREREKEREGQRKRERQRERGRESVTATTQVLEPTLDMRVSPRAWEGVHCTPPPGSCSSLYFIAVRFRVAHHSAPEMSNICLLARVIRPERVPSMSEWDVWPLDQSWNTAGLRNALAICLFFIFLPFPISSFSIFHSVCILVSFPNSLPCSLPTYTEWAKGGLQSGSEAGRDNGTSLTSAPACPPAQHSRSPPCPPCAHQESTARLPILLWVFWGLFCFACMLS